MKTQNDFGLHRLTAFAARRYRRLWRAGVALALAMPHAAYPYALEQLLGMPVEHLLQLRISPRRVLLVDADRHVGIDCVSHRGPHAA